MRGVQLRLGVTETDRAGRLLDSRATVRAVDHAHLSIGEEASHSNGKLNDGMKLRRIS